MSWIKSVFNPKDENEDFTRLENLPKNPPKAPKEENCSENLPKEIKLEDFFMGEIPPESMEQLIIEIEDIEDKSKQTIQPNSAIKPIAKGTTKKKQAYVPKMIWEENKKLTIILVENTKEVEKEKDKLEKIVKSLVTTGYVVVINYGSSVDESKIVEVKHFDCSKLLCEKSIGENTCLFDALITLDGIVEKYYNKPIEEMSFKKVMIREMEIIGIGRCIDNCSIAPKALALESFYKFSSNKDIITKYFCLSEENFIEAATIGFHSIGALPRNYKQS